ncbi:hypothetical protein [Stenotrophomonas phage YB07]|uniref:Uncharacterized protein n=1 Tax=Stenotrophomonas phage YB07 TaxID=2555548 RepID=A0A482ID61_9CAUD|nr:hypothetical protein HWC11_gp203 [Stenotrophomonas phage YB07]QBP06399.1 hypothetical protein [Stenotrophomonas phage YB07]
MATCLETINSTPIPSIPVITPNTQMGFSINSFNNQLFLMQSALFQTAKFTVQLTTINPNMTMTFYTQSGGTWVPVSSVAINQTSTTFTADFPAGEYIVCLRTTSAFAQAGYFVGEFTGYSQVAVLQPRAYQGEYSVGTFYEKPRPPVECKEALFYTITEGSMPPGLFMDNLGTITGILPNLDCLKDRWSPAANWYYDENDGYAYPWGREWRFKVKVEVANYPESNAEDWFCIKIHNNWDFDLENFLRQAPFKKVHQVNVVTQSPGLDTSGMCIPCKEPEQSPIYVPQPVRDTGCAACSAQSEAQQIELIEIPTELCQCPVEEILPWYQDNFSEVFECEALNEFVGALSDSPSFQILRRKAGYLPDDPLTDLVKEQTFIAVSAYNNFLQLAQVTISPQSDPSSMTALLQQWRDYENQVLPTNPLVYTGESLSVELTV